jgi:hypothetical protein
MADKQLLVRLGVAVVALGAVAGGFVLLTSRDEAPPANTVAVVGAPPAAAHAPPAVPSAAPQQQAAAPAAKPQTGVDVVYELSGSGTATVVYDANGLGLVQQELSVPLPWKKELTWPASATAPTVQLLGQSDGVVECAVSVRGAVVVSRRSKPGEVATCAGKLGQ